MSMILDNLELVYYQTETNRELIEDERVQRYESFEIGLNKEVIDVWYEKRHEQLQEIRCNATASNG